MFGKKKELEAAIEELKAKLSEQEALNARLEQAIEEYKRKEGAIANALTRAQSDAGKVIDEANAEGCKGGQQKQREAALDRPADECGINGGLGAPLMPGVRHGIIPPVLECTA